MAVLLEFAAACAIALGTPQEKPDPPVYLRITTVGPAGFRARLGPTNLGAMLASAEGEASWRPMVDRLDAQLRHLRGDAEAFARERAQLLEYAGNVHVVAWLEQKEDALHLARWSAAVIVEPDGRTDLPTLAGQLHGWLQRAQGRHGALQWREIEIAPPQVHDGRLVTILARPEDREAAFARALALRPRPLPRGGSVLRIEIDLQQVILLLRDRPPQRGVVSALLGPGTSTFGLTVGTAGPQLAVDLSLGFGAGDRGAFGALSSARAGVPALDSLHVPDAVFQCTTRVDFAGLWRAYESAVAAYEDREVAEVRAAMVKAYGLAVADEELVHLGDEALFVWSVSPHEGSGGALSGVTGVVVRLRDETAFRAALNKELRHRARWSTRLEDDERLVADTGTSCIGAGHGFACLFERAGAADHVRDVLDLAEAWKQGPGRMAVPDRVHPHAPPGWNGRGTVDVAVLASKHLVQLAGLLQLHAGAGLPLPIAAELEREFERTLPLFRRHELTVATVLTGATAAAWQLRFLW